MALEQLNKLPTEKKKPVNVKPKKAESNNSNQCQPVQPTETQEEKMNAELDTIPVPTSIAMNQFRQDINNAIMNTPLHIECVMEVLRSAVVSVEAAAMQTAAKEMEEYRFKVEEVQKKYTSPNK